MVWINDYRYEIQVSGGCADFGRKVSFVINVSHILSRFDKIKALYISYNIYNIYDNQLASVKCNTIGIVKEIMWEIAGEPVPQSESVRDLKIELSESIDSKWNISSEKNRRWIKIPWIDNDYDWKSIYSNLQELKLNITYADRTPETIDYFLEAYMIIEGY